MDMIRERIRNVKCSATGKPDIGFGMHFCPTDQECLVFLKERADGVKLPSYAIVETDLYSPESTPWDLFVDTDPWENVHESDDDSWIDDCVLLSSDSSDEDDDVEHVRELSKDNVVLKDVVQHDNKKKKRLHVITKLSNLSPKEIEGTAEKIERRAGCGTWICEDKKGKEITSEDEIEELIVGIKKSFTFVVNEDVKSEARGDWTMEEYSLANRKTDFVLCKVTRSDSATSSNKKGSILVAPFEEHDGGNLEEETSNSSKKMKPEASVSTI